MRSHRALQTPASTVPTGLRRILFALYLGQGMLGGLLALALPVALRERGTTTQTIGLLYLCMLPWVLKLLWAKRIDRDGRWRDWIVRPQAGCILLLLGLGGAGLLHDPFFVPGIGVLLFALSILMAVQDTAIDGYAVDRTPATHRGAVNGIMLGSASLGALLGGGATLVLLPHLGWTLVVTALAVVMTFCWLLARQMPSTPRIAAPEHGPPVITAPPRIGRQGRHRMAFAVAFITAQRFSLIMVGPYLLDRSLALSTVGWLQGIGGTLAALTAAVLCTLLLRRAPLPPVMAGLLGAQALVWAAITWTAASRTATPAELAAALSVLQAGLVCAGFVVFYGLTMGWCRAERPATDFALVQSLDSAIAIGCAVLGGTIVSAAGYVPLFAATTLFMLIVGPWAWLGRRDLSGTTDPMEPSR